MQVGNFWNVRFSVVKDDGAEESHFLKFFDAKAPGDLEIKDAVARFIENNQQPVIPVADSVPVLESVPVVQIQPVEVPSVDSTQADLVLSLQQQLEVEVLRADANFVNFQTAVKEVDLCEAELAQRVKQLNEAQREVSSLGVRQQQLVSEIADLHKQLEILNTLLQQNVWIRSWTAVTSFFSRIFKR